MGSPTIYERNQVIVKTPNTTGIAKIILLITKSLSFILEPSSRPIYCLQVYLLFILATIIQLCKLDAANCIVYLSIWLSFLKYLRIISNS